MFATRDEHPGTPPTVQSQFILIVDDERASRRALSQLLQICGYETRMAASAEDAIRLLRPEKHQAMPAVALVDLNLPGMDGVELISKLQDIDQKLFAILITANDCPDVREQIDQRQLGYLRKPIDFGSLLHLIREHFPVP